MPVSDNCSLYHTNLEWKHFCKTVPFKRVKSVLVSNGVEKIQYCMFLYVLIVVHGLGGLRDKQSARSKLFRYFLPIKIKIILGEQFVL